MIFRWIPIIFKRLTRLDIFSRLNNNAWLKAHKAKIFSITGAAFLVFVISFSIYTAIRKSQQSHIQTAAAPLIKKAVNAISGNWNYLDTQSLMSNVLIRQIGNNINILENFSRLGKLISQDKPVFLKTDPAPYTDTTSMIVSYKVLATFENGQAVFLFNLADQGGVAAINYINIDAVYNINTRLSLSTEQLL